jgi:hypothetical protein
MNSVGSFRIFARVENSINHDYSANEEYYNITITQATPTFALTLAIIPPLPFVYNGKYNIPYPTTSNTDPNPVFSYSIINKGNINVASVSGTIVTIKGVGQFQISVTIMATTNYTSATYTYPSPSTYYTSIKATTQIKFPDPYNVTAVYDTSYNFLPVQFVVGDSSTQTITYSIQ